MDSEWKDYLSPLSMRYNNIFGASLDETEMIGYDTQCASAATADTLK